MKRYSVAVCVDNHPNQRCFTNNVILQGHVVIQVHRYLELSQIQVVFEGESKTRLPYVFLDSGTRNAYTSEGSNCVVSIHKLVSEKHTLFPSSAEQQVMSSSCTYTLAPGTYKYPFQFRIPMTNKCVSRRPYKWVDDHPATYGTVQDHGCIHRINTHWPTLLGESENVHISSLLPPTSTFDRFAAVSYTVTALVIGNKHRVHNLVRVPVPFEPIDVSTLSGLRARDGRPRTMVARTGPLESSFFMVNLHSPYLVKGRPFGGSISFECINAMASELTTIYLNRIQVLLVADVEFRAKVDSLFSAMNMALDKKTKLLLDKRLDGYKLDLRASALNTDATITNKITNKILLPIDFHQCVVPQDTVPTFETCNITLTYKLVVSIAYTRKPPEKFSLMPKLLAPNETVHLTSDNIIVVTGRPLEPGPEAISASKEPLPEYASLPAPAYTA